MKKKRTGYKLSNLIINIFISIVCILFVIPIMYILSVSFSSEKDISSYGFSIIPRTFSTMAYQYVLKDFAVIGNAYLISIVVTVVGSVLSLLLTTALAYAMARRDFRLSKYITRYVLFTMLFNGGLVAWYMLNTRILHIQDTLIVLILPYLIIPWHVFLMRGFMMDFPLAILESANIDGASEYRIFFNIVLPLSKPALATVGLFCAFIYWNDWWLSMLYIENLRLVPVQLMLYRIMNNINFILNLAQPGTVIIDKSNLPNESARMAIAVLATGPMMFVFPFFQKYFVKGLVVGSVKG